MILQYHQTGKENCNEIAFIQTNRVIQSGGPLIFPREQPRLSPGGWAVDQIEDNESGYYGYIRPNLPTPGNMPGRPPMIGPFLTDAPRSPAAKQLNSQWFFESCAVCKNGPEIGKIYSCTTWGYDVDAAGNVTFHPRDDTPKPPSKDFMEAVQGWNNQAAAPGPNLQAPPGGTQQPFPRLYY